MDPRFDDLFRQSRAQLLALYRTHGPGRLPAGTTRGAFLVAPGTPLARPLAKLVRALLWRGKRFCPDRGDLLNRVGPLGWLGVRARVFLGPSRLDGKPSILLDYSRTSLIARPIRDEIREVAPGLYLGYAYVGRWRLLTFALHAARFTPARDTPDDARGEEFRSRAVQ